MSEENNKKSALVPRLRFPEFRNHRPWVLKELVQVLTTISNGVSLPQNSSGPGLRVTRIETIADGTIDLDRVGYVDALKNELEDYRLNIGDLLLSNINSIAHIGKSVLIDADYDLYHGMNLLRLRVDAKSNSPQFVYFAINTPAVRGSIRGRANKAVNQASINQTELGRTIIPLPPRPEQQKIADCLSSLDELITAETQVLTALKTHKKGLMQQLFPREGETVPRLRFPEFREAGEWVSKSLKNACEVNPANAELPEKFAYIDLESVENGELKARRIINRDEAPSRAQRLLRYGDVIFQIVRPYQRNNLHFKINEEVPYVASTGYAQLRANESEDFLFQAVHTDDFVKRVIAKCTGSSYPAINSSDLADISLPIPSKAEQQKIADCLSSLDDLITAQRQKIEALKKHKKGLMQQLFPSSGGVAGEAGRGG